MKEELLKQIQPILEMTKNGIIAAAEAIQQQAPQVVAEIYRWGFWSNLIWAIIFLLVTITSIWLTIYWIKNMFTCDHWIYQRNCEPFIMVWFFIGIISIIMTVIFTCTVLKILIVPKLFLIQYLAEVIK